jgi:hypothetical protein
MASRRRVKDREGAGEQPASDEFVDSVPSEDVGVVDVREARVVERSGEPLRVCLACGEEEPNEPNVSCAHREVAVFAEAPQSAHAGAERVRKAMLELAKAQRALSGVARGAVSDGTAVIDERPEPAREPIEREPPPCPACAERAAMDAALADRVKPRRPKRVKPIVTQESFAFAASRAEDEREIEPALSEPTNSDAKNDTVPTEVSDHATPDAIDERAA